ncbi:terpenoid synthase [Mycena rebaudengoi]|nr:terpenoid synthase [Mycena rebaudengoi]
MPTNILGPIEFHLPDMLSNWPWPRNLNQHYAACKQGSAAWLESFHAFSPKAQNAFNLCDFNLIASLAYPLLDKDGCRVGCDLMNFFFVVDHYTDVANPEGAKAHAEIVMHALRNPELSRPQGEWIGGEVARQFWLNAIRIATPISQRRFIQSFGLYLDAVVQQAQDRTENHIRGIDEYFEIRRNTIGAKPSFVINAIRMSIPDEVMENEHIKMLTVAAIDMIITVNDACSYNVEQAIGDDGHNLVTIVMHSLNLDLQAALEWILLLHESLAKKFLSAFTQVPHYSEPELDRQVTEYIHGLGNWVRANEAWSFECERYFGARGKEIQVTRGVELLPRICPAKTAVPEILIPYTA